MRLCGVLRNHRYGGETQGVACFAAAARHFRTEGKGIGILRMG